MQTLENTKKFIPIFHVEPGSVVFDEINGFQILFVATNFDFLQFPF